ncbi:fibroblast growth factor-binding protein 3 [Hemicordylus capensis]|uniref:fibroblast growth factor-binding protein 3 n=1 Tax=Hemicordylus capensis TaxID=884348 RepID=UPI0023024DB3|nr:fibroblast growth factor-binding protein 3 [Hemicordylus capensis]
MRLPQTLPLTLLFLSCLEGASGRKGKENSEQAKPSSSSSSSWAQSGQFSTRDKHLCSWQLISREEATELQLSCHQPGEESSKGQQCIYQGHPELCAAYNSKGRQFWKQILGKLRRKRHPCQDSSPLKSRLCSSKKGASVQLQLVPTIPSMEAPGVTEGLAKGRSKGKGRAKDLSAPQKPKDRAISSPAKADAPDKRSKGGKRKAIASSSVAPTQPPRRQPTAIVEGTEQPTEFNADIAQAYCEEKWHSLCNFFVNFWNG